MEQIKKLISNNEFVLGLVVIFLFIIIGTQNSAFFTINNAYDLIRSLTVPAIFVVCALIVLISGGIDVSFPAIATFSMYTTTTILVNMDFQGSVFVAYGISACIGLLLGLINATFISLLKLPTLIVTLGTSAMYSGFLLTFIGNGQIHRLPPEMAEMARKQIFKRTTENGITLGLPITVIITFIIIIIVAIVLKYTVIGRSIYAFGGDPLSAERIGISQLKTQFFVYCLVGMLAGIAGLSHTIMMRNSNPVDLLGGELLIIAAAVIGGAKITGGFGTVKGALLGIILVVTIQNSLILMGIPSYWQRVVIGALILIGTGISAYQYKKAQSKKTILVQ